MFDDSIAELTSLDWSLEPNFFNLSSDLLNTLAETAYSPDLGIDYSLDRDLTLGSDYYGISDSLVSDRIGIFNHLTSDRDYLTGFTSNDVLAGNTELASLSTTAPTFTNSITKPFVEGTSAADRFIFNPLSILAVFSGNGNVEYGSGKRDTLDLSGVLSSTVKFNLVTPQSGGVFFNTGDGTRLFDEITLSNGSRILFEGIEQIKLADKTFNLVDVPSDTYFNQQWNLHMTGVHTAWRFTTGSDDVLIGIEDSGLGVSSTSKTHYDLRTTLIDNSQNYIDEFVENGHSKENSHGTGVQGIIAAETDNGGGISGINWSSPVYHVDVIGDSSSDFSLAYGAQKIIDEAKSQGQNLVINLSLSNSNPSSQSSLIFSNLVKTNPNVLFVISSGNNGEQGIGISYPAILAKDYDNVIAVGAAAQNGSWISYSQYGTGLTLVAPSLVHTTEASSLTSGFAEFKIDDDFNGTSAAAPHVTGISSLLWSVNPNLTATQIKDIVSDTALDLGTTGYDIYYGSGLINADAAVREALALARLTA